MYKPKRVLSIGMWCVKRRGADRFEIGGPPDSRGPGTTPEALAELQKLSLELQNDDCEGIRGSLHTVHELRTDVPAMVQYNSPGAIGFDDLVAGITAGTYPKITMVTAPAFGFSGSQLGAILHPDPNRNALAKLLHLEAISRSRQLKKLGHGAGKAVWWPGNDAYQLRPVANDAKLSNEIIMASGEWQRLVEFWTAVAREAHDLDIVRETLESDAEPLIEFELKGGDPKRDVACTPYLARKLRAEINEKAGFLFMSSNEETAHILGVGELYAETLRDNDAEGQFHGMLHLNAGHLLPVRFHDLLEVGCHPDDLPIVIDWDWAFGTGSPKVRQDAKETVFFLAEWSARTGQPVYAEFDILSGHENTLDFTRANVSAFEAWWKEAVAALSQQ